MNRLGALLVQHRDDLRWALLIFAVAFVIRLAFVLWVDPSPQTGKVDDSNFYYLSGRAMAHGQGYINPWRKVPTAQWPPGYTAVLSSVFVLPGPDLIAAQMLNVVLSALTCSLTFVLGRMMWGRAIGITAGLLLTFFPSHVFFSALVLSETVYVALLSGIMVLFAWALTRASHVGLRLPVILGLGIGAATLVRGEGIFLPLVFGAAWAVSVASLKQGVRFAALAFVGVAIVLAPWTARNVVQMGAPIPVSTASARMAQAHWDGADGGHDDERVRELNAAFPDVPYPKREVKISQKSLHDGLRYMATHPVKELSLIPRRLYFLYRHDSATVLLLDHKEIPLGADGLDRLRTVSNAYYFAVIGWSVLGAWLWWRARRDFTVVLVGMVVYLSALIGLVYAGEERYHAQLIPSFCLAAAPTLILVRESLRAPAQPTVPVRQPGDLPSSSRSAT